MQVETLQDLLEWTRKFHHYFASCLEHCAEKNKSERSRLLLDYLAKHEQHLEELIINLNQTSSINALNTWCLEYLDKKPLIKHQACAEPFSKLSSLDISEIIFEQHNQVIEFYRDLSAQIVAPSAMGLIEKLIALEEHEVKDMAQAVHQLEGL